MLTIEQRDRWAAALRDPDIAGKQMRQAWRSGDCRCCLTVLCDLEGRPEEADEESGWLAGLIGEFEIEDFIRWNDDDLYTFPQIAVKVDGLPVLADASQP